MTSTAVLPHDAATAYSVATPAAGGYGTPGRPSYTGQARRRFARADLLTVLAWLSVAVSAAMVLADGLQHKVGTFAGILTEAGVLTGMVATDLCVLMLLLAARIPLVDGAIGHDRAILAHRKLGAYTIIGLLLHGIFITLGYAASGALNPVAEFVSMLSTQDILLAVVGFAGLGLVGVSSFQAAKRKLGHEAWQAIHLLTYASVALSVPHQLSQGFLAQQSLMRWYWIALWAFTAFCLLAFRMILPLIATLSTSVRVVAVIPEGPGTVSIVMRGKRVEDLGARAGQFFHWRFLTPGLWWQQHPFSLSAAPRNDTLRITVRDLGTGSAALQHVKVGTRVALEGPYGLFSDAARTTSDGLVLAGAGIGIAPVRALLEETAVDHNTVVLLRAHREEELYLVDEIATICRQRGAALYVAAGPRSTAIDAASWLPASWQGVRLTDVAPLVRSSDLFICGPQAWTDAVIADALASGVPANHIHDERFSW